MSESLWSELAKALERYDKWTVLFGPAMMAPVESDSPIIAAARRQLAFTPETCEHLTDPFGEYINERGGCDRCGNRGTHHPRALVEWIAAELHHGEQRLVEFLNMAQARLVAVAVLDAINDWKPE
jgi:hypothetical protein